MYKYIFSKHLLLSKDSSNFNPETLHIHHKDEKFHFLEKSHIHVKTNSLTLLNKKPSSSDHTPAFPATKRPPPAPWLFTSS